MNTQGFYVDLIAETNILMPMSINLANLSSPELSQIIFYTTVLATPLQVHKG